MRALIVVLRKASADHRFDPTDRAEMEAALREYVREAHPDKKFQRD